MLYALVFGGALTAGAVPVIAYVAFKTSKSRRREREGRKRRAKKIQL